MTTPGARFIEREPLGDWRAQASCRTERPSTFYPVTEEGEAAAKAICATCPVQEPCLAYALKNREEGVWGNTTEWERDEGKRPRRGRPKKSRNYAREPNFPRDKGRYVTPDGRRKSSLPPSTPNPLCGCGCGEEVSWNNGVWSRWKRGHQNRVKTG